MSRAPVFPVVEKVRIVLSILAGEVRVAEAARRAKVSEQLVGGSRSHRPCHTSSSPKTPAAARRWPGSWPFSTRTSRTPDARRIAVRPQTCHDAIGDIAFRWGITNQAHLGRLFRQRYGLTPREVRRL
jgi:AraC-like DNA-binding protein